MNWCPHDQTVLANEQVVDGRCWRCGHLVERRNLSQWFLQITDYADRLLDGLDKLDGWPERTRDDAAQLDRPQRRRRSSRSRVEGLDARSTSSRRASTRSYGVTFLAIAPEHPVVAALQDASSRPHACARRSTRLPQASRPKSELERTSLMEKQGVFTGAYAINPLSRERVPIWVTNYVLAEYGTGAVMGVPAHDERDFEFARKHGCRSSQ